jgi:hypothetical protein
LRNSFFILLFVVFPANSAEFEFNGSVVKSAVNINETKCKGYSILVKEDRFPYEAEDNVPKEIALKGFLGTNVIVGAKAFLKKASTEHEITVSVEKYQRNGNLLNDGRTYIPGSGYCLNENAFLLSVWSGGNCKQCELLIKYQIGQDGGITEIGLPSQEEFHKALER